MDRFIWSEVSFKHGDAPRTDTTLALWLARLRYGFTTLARYHVALFSRQNVGISSLFRARLPSLKHDGSGLGREQLCGCRLF